VVKRTSNRHAVGGTHTIKQFMDERGLLMSQIGNTEGPESRRKGIDRGGWLHARRKVDHREGWSRTSKSFGAFGKFEFLGVSRDLRSWAQARVETRFV